MVALVLLVIPASSGEAASRVIPVRAPVGLADFLQPVQGRADLVDSLVEVVILDSAP